MAEILHALDWPLVEGVVSDLDGVVYRGKMAIQDAVEAFQIWRAAGIPYCFVTNNSTHTAADVVAKLNVFGLEVNEDNVVTSAEAAAQLIRGSHPAGTRVYVIGAPSLKKAILDAELEITEDKPAVVIMGLDREITHEKLRIAVDAILKGAVLIGTNPDLLLPTPAGFEPGAGAILTAVATAARVKPIIVRQACGPYDRNCAGAARNPQGVDVDDRRSNTHGYSGRKAGRAMFRSRDDWGAACK